MLPTRQLWVVNRVVDHTCPDIDYGMGSDTIEQRFPVCAFASKEEAAAYVKLLRGQVLKVDINGYPILGPKSLDPFVDRNHARYEVAVLPLLVPSAAETAGKELNEQIMILRDHALETSDKTLYGALPVLPIELPTWLTVNRHSTCSHFFQGTSASLCGLAFFKTGLPLPIKPHCQRCHNALLFGKNRGGKIGV